MAEIAFGTQRISSHNVTHIQALKEAIASGVKLIDTSLEYLDSKALQAISIAFREIDKEITDKVKIVSKFSYKEEGDVEKILIDTLHNLNMKTIDCFMLYNIEYYLIDAINKGINKDDRLDGMNKIIYKIFLELEKEVKNKKFNSYGISSDNFSYDHNLEQFLPYEDLISIAQKAASDAGNDKHSFTTIEFPLNIVETHGLKCATWAKENNLRVLTSRPLNVIYNSKYYRLAQYDTSKEYDYYLNEILDVCDNDTLRPLYNFVYELDSLKHKFGWIEDYDNFLFSKGLAHIKAVILRVDEENQQTLINLASVFLEHYRKMVAQECSDKTKIELKEFFSDCQLRMQDCALEFLKQQKNVDYVLLGMRKPSYVAEVLGAI
jgi:aryl-alcohol dehydrogenase-like predicted oxidoreductase